MPAMGYLLLIALVSLLSFTPLPFTEHTLHYCLVKALVQQMRNILQSRTQSQAIIHPIVLPAGGSSLPSGAPLHSQPPAEARGGPGAAALGVNGSCARMNSSARAERASRENTTAAHCCATSGINLSHQTGTCKSQTGLGVPQAANPGVIPAP